jgi:hypothetical protein
LVVDGWCVVDDDDYNQTVLGQQHPQIPKYYRFIFTCFIYILANYYLLPLDTLNPLFTANR